MRASRGFTLIELIVGMVVFSIAVVLLATVLFPQSDNAAKTLQRVRAAELAQSVMNEIWGKAYDENTPLSGIPACDSADGLACSTALGPDGNESRNDFDDVDDYNGMTETALRLNSNRSYADDYPGYQLLVTVSYGDNANTKLIHVVVTTPQNEPIAFDALRSNF